MITIQFNKKKLHLEKQYNLNEILKLHGFTENYFSIAINQNFIARINYSSTILNNGDIIEIISPMQGG